MRISETPVPALGRILVVDDEISIVENLVASLSRFGYEVTGVGSAGKALEALEVQDFDVLLTDLKLGGMDGIELLRAALKMKPDLIGIIMTGYATVETAVEAMKHGAFDYVTKPFRPNHLQPVLSRAMEVRRLRTENIQLRETIAIYNLTRAIAFPLNDGAILDKVAEAVQQESEADDVSIMLPTPDGLALYVAAARGSYQEHPGTRIPLREGAAAWMAGRHQGVFQWRQTDDRSSPISLRPDVHMALFMPVVAGGTFEGIINANITRNGRGFTPGQVKTLHILAGILAPLLASSRLFKKVSAAEEKYRSIFENSIEGIFQATPDGRYLSVNPALARMHGYASPEEMIEAVKDIRAEQFVDPADRDRLAALYESQGFVEQFETQRRRKDGESFWTSVNARAVRDGDGHLRYYEGTAIEISRRKKAEEALRESEGHYRSLFDNMLNGFAYCRMIFDQNRAVDFIYLNVNNAFEGLTGLKNVIGRKASEVIPGLLESDPGLLDLYGRVALTGTPERLETYLHALKMWFSISVYSPQKEHIMVVFDVITAQKNAEAELKTSHQTLEHTLDATVTALATAVEMRDPYTAGHQRRVARLASAIAQQMGLSEDQVDSLRVIGFLHDIGKIVIPAEILSKPSALNEYEFGLIKSHPSAGYDVVKGVTFPWPLAEAVLQHHERLDGSGYPSRLSGDAIILEARILAVADVVEAMTSHRPYRPAKTMEEALEEISAGKGTRYDVQVVEACVRLVKEKGLVFE